ncbi:MAG: ComEA family DNA-binding protein [Acidobacteria bacterium]|nr:ComEA family DNA-binding protein [Acidobacteriota bacterium]
MRNLLALIVACALAAWSGTALAQERSVQGQPGQTSKPAKTVPAPASININTATAVELEALPGVGAATAARILEYRQKNGGFKKIEELMNVRGIGEKTFLNLKALIVVAPPRGGA